VQHNYTELSSENGIEQQHIEGIVQIKVQLQLCVPSRTEAPPSRYHSLYTEACNSPEKKDKINYFI
jgi:hypothetical protein